MITVFCIGVKFYCACAYLLVRFGEPNNDERLFDAMHVSCELSPPLEFIFRALDWGVALLSECEKPRWGEISVLPYCNGGMAMVAVTHKVIFEGCVAASVFSEVFIEVRVFICARATLKRVWLIRSAPKFSCGWCGIVVRWVVSMVFISV